MDLPGGRVNYVRPIRKLAVIADNDARSAARLKKWLKEFGYEVLEIPDPEALVAAIGNYPDALVFAAPPSPDATNLCAQIRERGRGCYVILLLDEYDPEAAAAAFDAGADDVLAKPLGAAEFRTRLQRAMRTMSLEDYRTRVEAEASLFTEIAARACVHSRRYLDAQLGHEYDRARRFAHALAFILVEVSVAGIDDRLLRSFGRFLHNHLRAHVDWIARYSDKRFALVLPETDLGGAFRAAQRLKAALSETALTAAGLPSRLRVNFGISALDRVTTMELSDSQQLVDAAEHSLAEAVRKGPNQIAGGHPSHAH